MPKIGDSNLPITVLNERVGSGGINILRDAPDSVIKRYTPDGTFPNAVNAFLIRRGSEVWMVDTGFGRNIFKIMDSLGISPSGVQQVLLTHMHGDHVGGLLRDSTVMFPNAQVILSQKEFEYWSGGGERMKQAGDIFRLYSRQVKQQKPQPLDAAFPDGIHMIEAYGHTPGHVMFLIKEGPQQLLIWGDLVHAPAIQLPHPEVTVIYDVDPDAARATRIKVLNYIQQNSIPFTGMHLLPPR